MILLWGVPDETPMARVAEELSDLRAPVCFVDQRRYSDIGGELHVEDGGCSGWLSIAGDRTDLNVITGAYLRPYPLAPTPGHEAGHANVLDQLLLTWAEIAPTAVAVINRPDAMASNDSKPDQTEIIRRYGFDVPETVVTNDPGVAEQFWDRHRTVVYKSTSGIRSIVNTLSQSHRDRLNLVETCPTQFQAYIPGDDYRVHTVDQHVFATRIRSTAPDYRYAGRQNGDRTMESAQLPDPVANRCVSMTRGLGLLVAGIDLRRTPDGIWYCFEVNTSPAHSWFEEHTSQPIAHAIARLLTEASG